jgi:hypothetical protein
MLLILISNPLIKAFANIVGYFLLSIFSNLLKFSNIYVDLIEVKQSVLKDFTFMFDIQEVQFSNLMLI